jgi:divalent metal cation (Fe/Co/Zn/Cd) transporter
MGGQDQSGVLDERASLLSRGIYLELATIGWNVVEALVALAAGFAAGSVALVGFGLDSVIESMSGLVVYRRLSLERRGASASQSEAGERRALWFVGVSFYLIAAYVAYEAVTSLLHRSTPGISRVGLILAVASLVVMPILGWAKHHTGEALKSQALMADATETLVCAYLSFTLLLGLGLNAAIGWWWADPVAALIMLPLIVHEGNDAISSAASRSSNTE